jgi:hypothetical protein
MINLQPFMKLKKRIPLFLLLVLSIQFLPLQRIAVWLSSGQVTEEMAHGLDTPTGKSLPFENDPAILLHSFKTDGQDLLASVFKNYHHDESLSVRDADEILTPPPNE